MNRVLILTASYGDGHNAAAQNISAALEMLSPSTRLAVLDPLQISYGRLNTAARKAYDGIVRYAPALWSGIYSVLDSTSRPEKGFDHSFVHFPNLFQFL
jgi:processive 1,2-diacylglycerol beta-glucosyltransferase